MNLLIETFFKCYQGVTDDLKTQFELFIRTCSFVFVFLYYLHFLFNLKHF